jgi:hypothetical protein
MVSALFWSRRLSLPQVLTNVKFFNSVSYLVSYFWDICLILGRPAGVRGERSPSRSPGYRRRLRRR